MSTKPAVRPPDTRAADRKVSLPDRIALHIGMALIIWSRRTRRVRPAPDPELVRRLERERADREAEWILLGAYLNRWR